MWQPCRRPARELDQLLPRALRRVGGGQSGVDVVGRRRGRRARHLREDELAPEHRGRLGTVGEVRGDAPLRQQARALTRRHRHGHELAVGHAADAVIRRQLLVEVRDGAGEQRREQAVTLAQGLVDELPRLLDQQPTDVGREGRRLGEVRHAFQLAPLHVKIAEHGAATIIHQHTHGLRPHVGGRAQLSVFRGLRQRRIGDAAPKQERQPRRRFFRRQLHDGRAARVGFAELEPIEEIRRLQHGADDELDRDGESVRLSAHVERLIVGDLPLFERPPERARPEAANEVRRAGVLPGGRVRVAAEQFLRLAVPVAFGQRRRRALEIVDDDRAQRGALRTVEKARLRGLRDELVGGPGGVATGA